MPREKGRRPGADVRRKEILEAAVKVFGNKNYHWATTKEIAEEAGVSERMIFFYFDSKKNLYKAAIVAVAGELMEMLTRGNPPIDDIKTFIKMTSRNYITYVKENKLAMKLLLQSIDLASDEEISSTLEDLFKGFYGFTRSFLESAQESGRIEEDVKIDTVAAFTMGLLILLSYSEFLGLDLFEGTGEDIYSVGDHFVDSITGSMNQS